MQRGASTLNARTDDDRSGLPNTISILTGRPAARSQGGHGVTSERLPRHDGPRRSRAVRLEHLRHGPQPRAPYRLLLGRLPIGLVSRTWDTRYAGADGYGVDNGRTKITSRLLGSDADATRAARSALATRPHGLTVVQLNGALRTGAESGSRGRALDAVATMDRRVGAIIDTIRSSSATASSTLVIVTSSTPGTAGSYGYGIPLVVWGPSVEKADLYALNPTYRNPGSARLPSSGRPINTGVIGNLVTSALTLPMIPRSQLNARQNLDVFGP